MLTTLGHVKKLGPFGVVVQATSPDADLSEVSGLFLRRLLDHNPFVLLRGFHPLDRTEMERHWRQLGTAFSLPKEFVAHDWPTSHLYSRERVPLHCDEILAGRSPSFSVLQCYGAQASDNGGESFFCDSARVLGRASAKQRRHWSGITLDYQVSGCAGLISQPLVTFHRDGRMPVLRYAEPFDQGELGFVKYAVSKMPASASDDLVLELEMALYDTEVVVSHSWRLYDIVITDDRRVLHGRSPLRGAEPYPFHLQRIQVF